jgi:hypothetical protein
VLSYPVLCVAVAAHSQGKDNKVASLTGVHAALQKKINFICSKAGTPVYELRGMGDYKLVYELYCRGSNVRADNAGSNSVHLSMTFDNLVDICHQLLESSEKEDIRNLALILYQFATVSRGDDVRPRRMSELMVRYLKSVGE